jgi:hypothetical protein
VKPLVPKTAMEQLEVEVELPDFYPKDAPVYPGSKTNRAAWHFGQVTAVFSTTDPLADVLVYINDFVSAQGWQNIENIEFGDGGSIVKGVKGMDGRSISVMLTKREGEGRSATMIVVSTDP